MRRARWSETRPRRYQSEYARIGARDTRTRSDARGRLPAVETVATPTLELWPDPRKVRRSRALAVFLLSNWLVMGAVVLLYGLRSLPGSLAFAFGLLTLLGGLSQLRGARLATTTPLVRLGPELLEYRFYTAGQLRSVELALLSGVRRTAPGELVLTRRNGGEASIPCLAMRDEDRQRLESALRSRSAC